MRIPDLKTQTFSVSLLDPTPFSTQKLKKKYHILHGSAELYHSLHGNAELL